MAHLANDVPTHLSSFFAADLGEHGLGNLLHANDVNLRIAKQAIAAGRDTRRGAYAGRAQKWRTMLILPLP